MSEEILAAAAERVEPMLEPVDGGVGQDVSYDALYDTIKTETDKLSSLAGLRCNWAEVETTAEELLTTKSKDLRVACYLATCKLRSTGLDNALDAMVLLSGLVERFWDTMYPPLRRMRARAGMIEWMSSHFDDGLSAYQPTLAEREKVLALDVVSKALDGLLREKMGDAYPGLGELRNAVRTMVRICPEPESEPEPEPEPVVDAAAEAEAEAITEAARVAEEQAAAEAAAKKVLSESEQAAIREEEERQLIQRASELVAAQRVSTAEEATDTIAEVGQGLVKLAFALRAQHPESSVAVRVSRVGLWLALDALPPSVDGKSKLPAPSDEVRLQLTALAEQRAWMSLLVGAETAASDHPLWLDAQRYVASAMAGMGGLFSDARRELLLQLALLIRRHGSLLQTRFADGTPLADVTTRAWIADEVAPFLDVARVASTAPHTFFRLRTETTKAEELVRSGDLPGALAMVRACVDGASPDQRFQGRLAMAELCVAAGQFGVACSQLDSLRRLIDVHALESWQPDLCARVYASLYRALRGLVEQRAEQGQASEQAEGEPQEGEKGAKGGAAPATRPPDGRAAEVLELLIKLDPVEALRVSSRS